MSLSTLDKFELKRELIRRGIAEQDAISLCEENVDGQVLSSITNEDLKELGWKLGNRKKLALLIEAEKNAPTITYTVLPSADVVDLPPVPVEVFSLPMITPNEPTTSFHMPDFNYRYPDYTNPETIPVLEALRGSQRGNNILKALADGDIVIAQNDVREVVRLVMATAVKDLQTFYPSYEQKVNIAKAIVTRIPQLKSTRDDCEGYEQFFDPQLKLGMIEWRLKTMRLSLPASKKKNVKRKDKTQIHIKEEQDEEDADMEDKINWLKYHVPSDVQKCDILAVMAETFNTRRKFIAREKPSIAKILKTYPRLKDFNGDLIDADFTRMHPNSESILGKFPTHYTPRVLKYCREKRLDIYNRHMFISDKNLSACLMLADLMIITGLKRKRSSGHALEVKSGHPSEYIAQFPGENVDMEVIIWEDTVSSQPFLICEGDKSKSLHFFLKLDSQIVDVGHCSMKAVDLLYKAHYVFNVKYNKACESFYSFMDFIIYNIKKGPSKGSIENLNTLLNMIKL